jgi:hypothetical protein
MLYAHSITEPAIPSAKAIAILESSGLSPAGQTGICCKTPVLSSGFATLVMGNQRTTI